MAIKANPNRKKEKFPSRTKDALALAEKIKENALKQKLLQKKQASADTDSSIKPEATEVSVSDGSKKF